jgi:hypothetical protein
MLAETTTAVAAALLVLTGAAKLTDPEPTMGALEAAALPARRRWAMGLGLVEILVAVPALVWGGRWAAPVAVMYLGFAGFVGWALARRIPIQSCGCFGRPDTPPTRFHVVFNLLAALAAAVVAITGGLGLVGVVGGLPWSGLPYVALTGLAVFLSYLLLAELPKTLSAVRETG